MGVENCCGVWEDGLESGGKGQRVVSEKDAHYIGIRELVKNASA